MVESLLCHSASDRVGRCHSRLDTKFHRSGSLVGRVFLYVLTVIRDVGCVSDAGGGGGKQDRLSPIQNIVSTTANMYMYVLGT